MYFFAVKASSFEAEILKSCNQPGGHAGQSLGLALRGELGLMRAPRLCKFITSNYIYY